MSIQPLYESVFQGLRQSSAKKQICLVEVSKGSVAVYPFNRRMEDVRARGIRKGFFGGCLASLVVFLVFVFAWSYSGNLIEEIDKKTLNISFPLKISPITSDDELPAESVKHIRVMPEAPNASLANNIADGAPKSRVLMSIRNESEVLRESSSRLLSLKADEKLIFVGTYASYSAAIGIFESLFHDYDALLIKTGRERNRPYAILVRYVGDDGGFERFREQISGNLRGPLLKWNRAARYQALI